MQGIGWCRHGVLHHPWNLSLHFTFYLDDGIHFSKSSKSYSNLKQSVVTCAVEKHVLACNKSQKDMPSFCNKEKQASPIRTSNSVLTCAAEKQVVACEKSLKDAYTPDISMALSSVVRKSASSIHGSTPKDSLIRGCWVKLICGASFEDVADVRNLSLVYTLAGVDCIDCAADYAVVSAVEEGIDVALNLVKQLHNGSGLLLRRPWIMVSVNDDEDLHFRKAEFNPKDCPPDCPRPCECVCPAAAIQFGTNMGVLKDLSRRQSRYLHVEGVITDRCYGCGRCLGVCPFGLIGAKMYTRNFDVVSEILDSGVVDAIEIHTSGRDLDAFQRLWESLNHSMSNLKLVAVSVPDLGDYMLPTMLNLYSMMEASLQCLNLWQLDGRPMSGDIGAGASKAAVALATRVAAYWNRPPGFLQLAGGTNASTFELMRKAGLLDSTRNGEFKMNGFPTMHKQMGMQAVIGGIAFGGYARKVVDKYLKKMDCSANGMNLECYPPLLLDALQEAVLLVGPLKGY